MSLNYEDRYGKVLLPLAEVEHSKGEITGSSSLGGKTALQSQMLSGWLCDDFQQESKLSKQSRANELMRAFSEWYCQDHGRAGSIVTASQFKVWSEEAGRVQEAQLWALVEDVLEAERPEIYNADAIGITKVQPHRRWFLTHYAHLQNLLQRHPVLRRACILCRWLEKVYRASQTMPTLRGCDDVMLRQLILTFVRGGELHKAVDASATYGDSSYCCLLDAAQLQTVREPWFALTALVPLFGEYAQGETERAWCGNEHRLSNLAQLYEVSLNHGIAQPNTQQAFDTIIGAALSGHLEVLESAFVVNNNWRDTTWCYLRCTLVVAFTKVLMNAQVPVEHRYARYVEQQTGGDEQWAEHFSRRLVTGLQQRLEQAGFLARASLEEQLQMRFMLQALSFEGISGEDEWFDIRPEGGNNEATRLITHMLLVLDAACRDTVSPYNVQAHVGDSLVHSMSQYASQLALLPHYPFESGLRATVAMAKRLRDHRHRAQIYAAFVRASRACEMERQELSRDELEKQEARLVRLLIEADPDPGARAETQKFLHQQVEAGELLTHNMVAERILLESMHADTPEDNLQVLRGGLEACVDFWLAPHHAELDAIADVSRILTQRVIPALGQRAVGAEEKEEGGGGSDNGAQDRGAGCTNIALGGGAAAGKGSACLPPTTTLTEWEWNEAIFWSAFSEARALATKHTKAASQLGAARALTTPQSANRVLIFQLAQEEASTMQNLVEQTRRAVRHGGAVVYRSRPCLTAVIWLMKLLTEDVTLSVLNSTSEREVTPLLQAVFSILQELDEAGYFLPSLLPREHASELYTSIRTMRVAYGQRVHRRHTEKALQRMESTLVNEGIGLH